MLRKIVFLLLIVCCSASAYATPNVGYVGISRDGQTWLNIRAIEEGVKRANLTEDMMIQYFEYWLALGLYSPPTAEKLPDKN